MIVGSALEHISRPNVFAPNCLCAQMSSRPNVSRPNVGFQKVNTCRSKSFYGISLLTKFGLVKNVKNNKDNSS